MKYLLLFIICSICCIENINSQVSDLSQQNIEKNSISLNILGSASYIGLSYERLFFNQIIAELGIGLIGIGVGLTYYPIKKIKSKQFNPYFGIKYTNHAIVDSENKSASYIPIGLSYFTSYGLNFHMDIGPSYFHYKSPGYMPTQEELDKYPFTDFGIWGNLKLGFRF